MQRISTIWNPTLVHLSHISHICTSDGFSKPERTEEEVSIPVLLFFPGTAGYFLTLPITGPSLSALLDAPRTNEGMRKSKNEDGFFSAFFLCAAAAAPAPAATRGLLFGFPRG